MDGLKPVINGDPIRWLLEDDPINPGVRYFTIMESTYNGKTYVDIEDKGQPSKWVTLRALRGLKQAFPGKG